jgi:hypothetical protein
MQILLCRNFGGHEEVHTTRTGSGFFGVYVICHGGILDGLECGSAEGPTTKVSECSFPSGKSREDVQPSIEPLDVSPSVNDGGGEQEQTAEPPVVPEPTTTPEPLPTEDVVVEEPVVDDGSVDEPAPPVEPTPETESPIVDDGAVVENPVVSDEPVDDTDSSGGKPGLPEPQIDPGDILPMEEPIILT